MIAPIYQNLSRKLEAYITEHGITGRLPGVLCSGPLRFPHGFLCSKKEPHFIRLLVYGL